PPLRKGGKTPLPRPLGATEESVDLGSIRPGQAQLCVSPPSGCLSYSLRNSVEPLVSVLPPPTCLRRFQTE
ncbi:MAG: hypothetical protein ACHRXM_38030, partial [Isosphaerales bacterium]